MIVRFQKFHKNRRLTCLWGAVQFQWRFRTPSLGNHTNGPLRAFWFHQSSLLELRLFTTLYRDLSKTNKTKHDCIKPRLYLNLKYLHHYKMNNSKVAKPIKTVGEWLAVHFLLCCIGIWGDYRKRRSGDCLQRKK